MPQVPARFAGLILAFAPLFVQHSWRPAQVLLIGAILSPGQRTVASILRVMGRSHDRCLVNFHRILSRAAWSPRRGACVLLGQLIAAVAPGGTVALALDDTIERRWGRRIQARGIYRDPVRSSGAHFVKTSGLRWMSLMLLAPIPWAGRVWALPFADRARAFRACLLRTRAPPQVPARCRAAARAAGPAPAAIARSRAGRRQRLFRP